jgi:hypothetical protein
MVHLGQVRQFVNNNIINDIIICHNESPRKVEVFLRGTTAPACLCAVYLDGSVSDGHLLGEHRNALGYMPSCNHAVYLDTSVFNIVRGKIGWHIENCIVKADAVAGFGNDGVLLATNGDYVTIIKAKTLAAFCTFGRESQFVYNPFLFRCNELVYISLRHFKWSADFNCAVTDMQREGLSVGAGEGVVHQIIPQTALSVSYKNSPCSYPHRCRETYRMGGCRFPCGWRYTRSSFYVWGKMSWDRRICLRFGSS